MITFLYFVFGIFLVYYELRRKKKSVIDSVFFVNLYWGTSYVLPAVVHGWSGFFGFDSVYKLQYGYSQENSVLGFAVCLMMYSSIIFTYRVFKRNSISYEYIIINQKRKSIYMASIILFFSVLLFLIYATQFGGPIYLITHANGIRGGTIQASNSAIMFLNKLFQCVRLAPLLIMPFAKKNLKIKIVTAIYWIIALLVTASSGSRGELLIFVLITFLGIVVEKGVTRIKFNFILKVGLIGYFGIVLLRPLMDVLPYLKTDGLPVVISKYFEIIFGSGEYSIQGFKGIMRNLTHSFEAPFISMETSLQVVNSGVTNIMFFKEWIASLLSPIPSLLLGITKPVILTVYNSYFISGQMNLIQVPSGVVAASYYSLGIFGPVFYGTILGWIAGKLDLFYLRIRNHVAFSSYYYVFILFIYFDLGLGGDLGTKFAIYLTTLILIGLIRLFLIRKIRLDQINITMKKDFKNVGGK